VNQSSNLQLRKRVWRITSDAPQGEYVDPDIPARPQHVATDVRVEEPEGGGWLESSFELAQGLEVSEEPDTVPAALLDEFFKD
jgi:hypothetical protein